MAMESSASQDGLTIRHATRARLSELRQERLRRRKKALPAGHVEAPIQADVAQSEVAEAEAVQEDALQEAPVEVDRLTDDTPMDVEMEESLEAVEDSDCEELPEEPAPDEAIAATDEAPAEEKEPEDTEAKAADDAAELGPDTPEQLKPESDLFQIPGAGPGLVWMLEKCGIRTLEDLSQADASALRQELGLVGEILDTQHWIDFAQQQINT